MAKCVRCGAETILYVGGEPRCAKCDAELEMKEKERTKPRSPDRKTNPPVGGEDHQALVSLYEEAVRDYRRRVLALSNAATSLEMDAFQRLWQQCAASRTECEQLRGELSPFWN
jgi:hypothetical protein